MLRNLRKKVLIQPRLQKKIIAQFLLLGVVMILVNLLSFYFLVSKVINQIQAFSSSHAEIYDSLMDTWSDLTLGTLVLSLVIVFSFCLYGLYFSNRIAGPLFHVRKAIARFVMGEKSVRIQLRRDDYLQELSEDVNLLMDKLSEKKSSECFDQQ